jgi:hypothetical protein
MGAKKNFCPKNIGQKSSAQPQMLGNSGGLHHRLWFKLFIVNRLNVNFKNGSRHRLLVFAHFS